MTAVFTREKPSAKIDQRDDIGIDDECPICAKFRDPVTGNLPYNAETIAAAEEARAMMKCRHSSKQYGSREELQQALRKILDE